MYIYIKMCVCVWDLHMYGSMDRWIDYVDR